VIEAFRRDAEKDPRDAGATLLTSAPPVVGSGFTSTTFHFRRPSGGKYVTLRLARHIYDLRFTRLGLNP